MGVQFYVGFRRFIVVANDEGNCTCVPILTYERRGCTKKGVKPQKHGIVYSEGARPSPMRNEPSMGFPPVRLRNDDLTERLAKESRVNYAKLVTIEHNVKVFFIGSIVDFDIVNEAVDKCWYLKTRQTGDSSRNRPREHRAEYRDSRERDPREHRRDLNRRR
ncbi:hypothetical protein B0T25DRAFT_95783 [Lasiosphaeria hispida]|uniref:DUF6590 domain-containing protein n=1 Tax=Lasiosphaeria hispida TaxID=260671 RepID=A0AAJ0HQ72_9PEZI|nr:hypothetical protein B0T25DRAFT_95783 [Lasiosphaeria hispida]